MLEDADVLRHMTQLAAQYPRADPAMVEGVVRTVLTSMRAEPGAVQKSLVGEVEELARTLSNARADIAALGPRAPVAGRNASATDELDAITAHTAAATDIILECCETLDMLSPSLSPQAARVVQDLTTQIYQACGFQDIVGQRITKVVAALQSIERKVAKIMAAFGPAPRPAARMGGPIPPSPLLHGPQLPDAAMNQSTIDALMASLD